MPKTDAERARDYRRRKNERIAAALQVHDLPPAPAISTIPPAKRWRALLSAAATSLQTLDEELTSWMEARSDSWKESDRGSELQEQLNKIQSIIIDVDDIEL